METKIDSMTTEKQETWEKEFNEDVKRKRWTSEQWKTSKEWLDRIIWCISSYSPHNLWKAKEVIREYTKSEIQCALNKQAKVLIKQLEQEKYTKKQGIDFEMQCYNDGLNKTISLIKKFANETEFINKSYCPIICSHCGKGHN